MLPSRQATLGVSGQTGSYTVTRTDPEEMVFDLYWVGDGRSGHVGVDTQARLLMRWNAIPSRLRALMASEVREEWLPLACAWAAALRVRMS